MYLYLVWPQSPSFSSNLGIFNLQRSRFLGKIWLENVAEMAPFIFRTTATAPLFFTLAPPRRAPPFTVRASGAVALKVAQVPSTGKRSYIIIYSAKISVGGKCTGFFKSNFIRIRSGRFILTQIRILVVTNEFSSCDKKLRS